ncbi:hypothetical protein WJX72_000772 [[Myrmecia] bisecta]|uniref:Uncharacterized protein n=1 Tax=[Myrmecia] bisecta TaxID=41462 RepID=A0AAW1QEK5_9CHLO
MDDSGGDTGRWFDDYLWWEFWYDTDNPPPASKTPSQEESQGSEPGFFARLFGGARAEDAPAGEAALQSELRSASQAEPSAAKPGWFEWLTGGTEGNSRDSTQGDRYTADKPASSWWSSADHDSASTSHTSSSSHDWSSSYSSSHDHTSSYDHSSTSDYSSSDYGGDSGDSGGDCGGSDD